MNLGHPIQEAVLQGIRLPICAIRLIYLVVRERERPRDQGVVACVRQSDRLISATRRADVAALCWSRQRMYWLRRAARACHGEHMVTLACAPIYGLIVASPSFTKAARLGCSPLRDGG
jgi:hypothetical protein